MKIIDIDLTHVEDEEIEIVGLSDLHIGARSSDLKLLKKEIDYIKNTPNCYVVGIGDYMDNALKLSKTDVYSATAPKKEIEMVLEYLGEIPKSRWLSMISGNHEHRTYREVGLDVNEFIAYRLELEDLYYPFMVVLRVKLRKCSYWILLHHGIGGGRMKGGKINNLVRFGEIVPNCDMVMVGHTHEQLTTTVSRLIIDKKHTEKTRCKNHIQYLAYSGSTLGYDGSYAEAFGLQPSSLGNVIATLTNRHQNDKYVSFRYFK